MIKPFDFFFDFSSPYAYLAHKQLRKIEKINNIEINYNPISLGGLHKLLGITSTAYIPSKAKFIIRDCKLISEKFDIPFKFNSYFPINSLNMMRGVMLVENKNIKKNYIDFFFNAYWQDNLNLADQKTLNTILLKLKINPETFILKISNTKIKDDLKKKTNDAFLKGIFGTPSFMINNKLFWGQDRIEFVLKEAGK